jgi:hypothetical protein
MSFGIKLTQKEQIKLDEHLREIEKGRDELSPSEIRYLTYKFKTKWLCQAVKILLSAAQLAVLPSKNHMSLN